MLSFALFRSSLLFAWFSLHICLASDLLAQPCYLSFTPALHLPHYPFPLSGVFQPFEQLSAFIQAWFLCGVCLVLCLHLGSVFAHVTVWTNHLWTQQMPCSKRNCMICLIPSGASKVIGEGPQPGNIDRKSSIWPAGSCHLSCGCMMFCLSGLKNF